MIDARLVRRFPSRKRTDSFVLDLHLRAAPGITALFGPSGAGKTLTLNCLAGFTKPDEGRILVDDQIFFDAATHVHLPPQQRRCGYLFQDHALFPHMTVRGNLQFAANSGGKGRLQRYRRINELLDTFELSPFAASKPSQLSGGQKQRAAIARMLVADPRLVLLDEPSRGLDARLMASLHTVLRTTREQLKAPMVLVTHDLAECFALADAVCLIQQGRIVQSGPTEQVFRKPVSAAVAQSLGLYDTLPAEILALDPGRDTSRLRLLGQDIEGPYFPGHLIGDRGFICLRRSELQVRGEKVSGSKNQLSVRLTSSSPSPEGVRLCFERDLFADISEAEFARLRGADMVYLELPRSAIHFVEK